MAGSALDAGLSDHPTTIRQAGRGYPFAVSNPGLTETLELYCHLVDDDGMYLSDDDVFAGVRQEMRVQVAHRHLQRTH
jgi:hypothetical protein